MPQETESNENELLIRRAVFGEQVSIFMNSEIGRYLVERANEDAADAVGKLKICDPKDGKVVQALQNEVYRAEAVVQWLRDAVADGLQALHLVEDRG